MRGEQILGEQPGILGPGCVEMRPKGGPPDRDDFGRRHFQEPFRAAGDAETAAAAAAEGNARVGAGHDHVIHDHQPGGEG